MQGTATRISDAEADRYFAEREEHIQILSYASEQGAGLESIEALRKRFRSGFLTSFTAPRTSGSFERNGFHL